MLVLIDESGDTGFKQGSSRFFVMSLIVFPDSDENGRYIEAEKTADIIKQVQADLNKRHEFHFLICSHKFRTAFFRGLNVNNCNFKIYTLVIDKTKIHSPHMKSNTKSFYNFILKQLLSKNPINNANVKIDGNKSKAFKKELNAYLRKNQDGMISKCTFADSKNDSLIQLADMCCSAIAYKYNRSDKLQSDDYYNLLGKRIADIWEFE